MDTYADDLATLVETLNLRDAIHVGHSTGGGEVARYIGRHGTKRVAKAVLIGAVTPLLLHTPETPGEPGRLADGGIRPNSHCCPSRPLAIFQGFERALLRRQPHQCQGFARL